MRQIVHIHAVHTVLVFTLEQRIFTRKNLEYKKSITQKSILNATINMPHLFISNYSFVGDNYRPGDKTPLFYIVMLT